MTLRRQIKLIGHLLSMMETRNYLENWISKAKENLSWTSSVSTTTGLFSITGRKITPCEISPTNNLDLMIELNIIVLLFPKELMDLDFKHEWFQINVLVVWTRHHVPMIKDAASAIILPPWLNLILIKYLDPAVCL